MSELAMLLPNLRKCFCRALYGAVACPSKPGTCKLGNGLTNNGSWEPLTAPFKIEPLFGANVKHFSLVTREVCCYNAALNCSKKWIPPAFSKSSAVARGLDKPEEPPGIEPSFNFK